LRLQLTVVASLCLGSVYFFPVAGGVQGISA
jgi:hypothetical protein